VSNLLPVFISKTLILREIQIKRALTSLFGIMSVTKHPLYIGDNAHGHYTLSTAVMSSALTAELRVFTAKHKVNLKVLNIPPFSTKNL
jgi:hypothetical protein